jgi:hypothetical protein
MKPSFLNLFRKKLTRDRVVPIISCTVPYSGRSQYRDSRRVCNFDQQILAASPTTSAK